MANGGRINYTVGFQVDKTGLTDLKNQLNEISKLSAEQIKIDNPHLSMDEANTALQKVKATINEIQPALDKAFDTTTGVINLERLNNSLSKMNLKEVQNNLNSIGPKGQEAFLKFSQSVLTANVNLKQTSHWLDKMGETLTNTIKWGIASSAMNNFTSAIQQAYGYVQHLDSSLNDIRIVTGKSADEMDRFAEKANKAASSLGSATTDYTEAALIYYQQGLGDEETAARAETTIKAANVTGQTGKQVSEELTAVWNGYKVTAEETEEYVDKLAAVAATTASNLEELSTGMSKVASAANNMGVDVDQLNAQLSTIISVTRQAPETAGTALKTIYARMEDLKISGEDEYGVKLGDVSSTLDEVGVHIMDVNGDLRDLGEVIEEVGEKWYTWTEAQRSAIAQAIAGKRQYNNLLALFDNWDKYNSALETSRQATGTLQRQQDIYMESTAAHIQKLETQWEDLYDSLLDTKDINSILDGLTKILDAITNIVDAVGGGKTVLTGLIALFTTKFSKQISQAFSPLITNMQQAKQNAETLKQLTKNIDFQESTGAISGNAAKAMKEAQQEMFKYWELMDEEQFNASQAAIREIGEWESKKEAIEESEKSLKNYINNLKTSENFGTDNLLFSGGDNNKAILNFFNNQSASTSKFSKSFAQLTEQVEELNYQIEIADEEFNSLNDINLAPIEEAFNQAEKDLIILQNQAKKGIIPQETVKAAEQALKTIEEKLMEMKLVSFPNGEKAFFTKDDFDAIRLANGELDKTNAKYQEYINLLEKGGMTQDQARIRLEQLDREFQKGNLEIQLRTQAVSELIGALASMVFVAQSIGNIGSILNDEDLTPMEKGKQIISSIAMVLPSAITGIKALDSAVGKLGISVAATNVVLLALTVVITTINYLYQKHQKQLENVAQAAKDNAEAIGKVIDKTKEEKQAIDDLANSYTSLLEQRDKNGRLSEEQQNEVYELVRAYGDEELIVQALSGDYDQLAESIQKVQELSNEQLINDLSRGISSTELSLQSNIVANAGETERDSTGFDLKGYNDRSFTYHATNFIADQTGFFSGLLLGKANEEINNKQNTDYENFEKDLANLIGKSGEDIINSSGHINYEDLEAILTSDSESLNELLDKYKDLDATTQLRELINNNSDTIQALKDYKEELNKAELDKIGYEHSEELKENIKDLATFNEQVNILAEEALKSGLVDEYEEGEKWAKEFLGGMSDEFAGYEQESYISDALLDAILPSDEEIKEKRKYIQEQLLDYSKGGNVNLNNRPEIDTQLLRDAGWEDADGEYATLYTKGYDMGNGEFINFTPIIVDPQTGEFIDVMTPEALDEYVNQIIEGTGTDTKNLQIGGAFGSAEEADKAAEAYHNLHEELHELNSEDYDIFVSDQVAEHLDNLSDAGKAYVADNIALFKALSEQGWTVDEIFENIQSDIDAVTAEDHVVKIKAVFDEGFDGNKISEKIESLFEDDSFDIGISQKTFEHLGSDTQAMLLGDQYQSEINALDSLSDEQVEAFKQREQDIENAIKDETALLDEANEKLDEHTQTYIDSAKESLQENFKLSPEEQESVLNEYEDISKRMGEAYSKAVEEGKDGVKAAADIAKNASDDVKKLLSEEVDKSGGTKEFLKGWAEVNDIQKDVNNFTDTVNNYKAELDDIPQYERDAYEELEVWAEQLEQVNNAIDDLQDSYQTLEDAVEEYNSQGYVSLDTLESIMTMDSSYVASLELVNGQLQINDSTYDSLIDSKIQSLKITATEQFMSELLALAQGEVANAAQEAEAANYSNADSIQQVIDKAKEGTVALTEFGTAYVESLGYDSAVIDQDDLETTVKSYENKLSLIDSLASQSTSSILGDSSSSSSSSSSDEPDTEEYLEREEDLYKAINEQLDNIESKLGRIDEIESHSWGINYANNLESQNELLKEQLDLLEEKKDTYEYDLSNQRSELESYGVTFTADGSAMTNTEDVLNSLYDEYNSMVDSYNSMSADEQDSYQDTLDSKKETIEDIEDAIDDYESAYSDYNGVLDDLLDTHYELIENEVKSFNAKIDVQLELDEAEQEWNDFWYEVVQDVDDTDFSGKIAQSIGKLNTLIGTVGDQQESQVATLTQHLNNTIEEVNKQIAGADNGGGDSIFGDDTALSKETLEDYRDKLMEAVRTAKEEIDEMAETYLDALESAKDLLDDQIEGWEAVGDHIEHNIELIQLVSGEKAYDALNMQFEQQYNNTLNLIETQRMSTEYWKERMEYYENMMATEEEGSKMYDTYAEALKKASENYRDAVNNLDKAIEDALKDLEEWRKNQVAAISDALDNALSKNMGLEDLKKQWDLVIEEQDYYLDNVERAMEMEGLNDAFNEVLDGLQGRNDLQKEFLKFQNDEVQKLNEKNKLTQYDIDEVKARLEIKKQELALEEAQQNKSNLRLRRDSQGNYTYQYTANEEDVEEAENGILTAKQEWYELVKRRNEETTNEVIDIRKRLLEAENEMAEALAAHNDEAYNNAKERYEFLINYMTELMGEGEKTKQDFYKGTAEYFADVNNSQILPMWNTTVQGMIDAWSGDGETSFLGSTKKAIEDLETVQDKFGKRTEEILERAGVKYEDLVNDGIDPTTEALEDMVDTNEELNDTLEETNNTLTELETNLQAAIEAYNSLKDAAVDAINSANETMNTLASTAVSAINTINNAVSTATSSVKTTASSATGGSSSGSGSNSGNGSNTSTKSSSTKYKVVDDPNGAENTYALKNLDTGKYVAIQGNLTSKNAAKVYWSDLDEKYRNNIYYDTGGYTGEWANGSERKNGRLAVLHQKELVLNESDTSNLLSAVNAVRSLVNGSKETNFDSLADSIVNMAQMQTSALANISSSMLQALASMVVNNNSDVSNYRNMTVNADFSGVQSADAIYQALMELDNYGTQQSYSEAPLANTRY